jgi:hypothetical protein
MPACSISHPVESDYRKESGAKGMPSIGGTLLEHSACAVILARCACAALC